MIQVHKLPNKWVLHNNTLLTKIHEVTVSNNAKIASFDFDDTLVKKHGFFSLKYDNCIERLRELYFNGYTLVIFSNECINRFKSSDSVMNIILNKLSKIDMFIELLRVPINVFIATNYDKYRKPSTKDINRGKGCGVGMFNAMLELLNIESIDHVNSFYVGDSDGSPRSFSDADYLFAKLICIEFIKDKQYFLST